MLSEKSHTKIVFSARFYKCKPIYYNRKQINACLGKVSMGQVAGDSTRGKFLQKKLKMKALLNSPHYGDGF